MPDEPTKRGRGRPPGSKNRPKEEALDAVIDLAAAAVDEHPDDRDAAAATFMEGLVAESKLSAREVRSIKATLGEVLHALAPTTPPHEIYTVDEFPIGQIRDNPHNARQTFDMFELQALADDIGERGLLNPISVVPIGEDEDGLSIVEVRAGSRRLRAVRDILGLSTIAVRVHGGLAADQGDVLSLVENLVRVDLNPMEEARGYARLRDEFGWRETHIADAVHRSPSSISNALRLLRLPADVQELLDSGRLGVSHALAIARFEDFLPIVSKLAALAVEHKLASHALEAKMPEANRLASAKLIRSMSSYEDNHLFAYCQMCPLNAFRSEHQGYGYCLQPDHYAAAKAEVDARRADIQKEIAANQEAAAERARAAITTRVQIEDAAAAAGLDVDNYLIRRAFETPGEGPFMPPLPKCGVDLAHGTYQLVRDEGPAGCTAACACRGLAINAWANVEKGPDGLFHPTEEDQIVEVCLQPERLRELIRAEAAAEDAARKEVLDAARSRAFGAIVSWKGDAAAALERRLELLGLLHVLAKMNGGWGVPNALLYDYQQLTRPDLEWVETQVPDIGRILHAAGLDRLENQLARAGGEAPVLRWLLGEPEPEPEVAAETDCTCGCDDDDPCSFNWPSFPESEPSGGDPVNPCVCRWCSGADDGEPCATCAFWEGDLHDSPAELVGAPA